MSLAAVETSSSHRRKRVLENNGDQREDPLNQTTTTTSNSRRKVGVFGDSGLTDAARRALRVEQRTLYETILTDNKNTNSNNAVNSREVFLDEARETNNKLFETVRFTREAVLDAENVDLIATKYVQQVDRLIQVCTVHSNVLLRCILFHFKGGFLYFGTECFMHTFLCERIQ
jgi:hypothetical protein